MKKEEVNELGLHGIKKSFNKEIATSETKFYKGSIRSGQKMEFEGSLVILGDVNAGAEVLAEDNVVILGILRGMAHAGAKGNKEAIIAAASIESAQIRIADIVKERQEGMAQERFNVIVNMLKEGMSIDNIAKFTKYTKAQITEIAKKNALL